MTRDRHPVTRRRVLATAATAAAASLAGCSILDGGDDGGSDDGGGGDGSGGSGVGDGGDMTTVEMTSDYWEFPTGNWEFDGDVMRNTSESSGNSAIAKNVSVENGTVAAEMNAVDGQRGMQLFWRGDGNFRQNYYRFGPLTLDGDPRLHWDLIQGGGFPGNIEIDPMGDLPVDIVPDEFHDYRVEFQGSRHRMYVDDTLIYEGEDDRLSGFGHIGFHLGNVCEIRDVRYAEGTPAGWEE